MKRKKTPLRKCVGCNQMHSKENLIRVIRTPEAEFLIDETGKKNGRGAYLCVDSQCYQLGMKRKGFERSFKQEIPIEIADKLSKEIEEIEKR